MSHDRKGRNKKSTPRLATPRSLKVQHDMPAVIEDDCGCSVCSGEDVDPQQVIDEQVASLAESEDPLQAELAGAQFVVVAELAEQEFDEVLIDGFIPRFEARASTGALAMLLGLGAVAEGQAAKAATAAADRLVAAGVARPRWADELDEPVMASDLCRIIDRGITASMLFCSFHRAGRSHAVIMTVDHGNCGAADTILPLDVDKIPDFMELIQAENSDVEFVQESLEPSELRWYVESALDARAVHDSELPWQAATTEPVDEGDLEADLPDYRVMAIMMRARMRALPAPSRSEASRDAGAHRALPTAQDFLASFGGNGDLAFGALAPAGRRGRVAPAKPAPKRKKSAGPAPVYRIKVGLRNARPPIWRRLEVPADINLGVLHEIIQVAFDWSGHHLHVFETSYGEFGTANADLGHLPEESVTLEQVAPRAQSKIRYTYDFGDGWEHDILLEKVLEPDLAVSYPRCTGGRRAAPPDDCGGIWGYAELLEVLAEPGHPEHQDMLDWLGLEDAGEFDPGEFDAEEVTEALSELFASGAR